MKRILTLLSGIALALSAWTAVAQRNFDNVQITATHVAGKVYMLEGSGGNIGVSAGEDGILIIDDQFAPLADKIRAAITEINPGKLVFLINTHFHGDHTGGNAIFGKEAHIIAQNNVRVRLRAGEDTPKEALPVITYNNGVNLYFNGEEIRLIYLGPAHTDGDTVIFFTGSNVIHMGDQFFNGRFPYIDLGSGGDVQGYLENVAAVIDMAPADAKIIPGHGALATLDDLKAFHQTIQKTADLIREQMKAGKSMEEIQNSNLLDEWQSWGAGFISTDRWVQTVYNSYSRD